MGRYLLEGDSSWMRTCSECGGAWHCRPPENSDADPKWTCEPCGNAAVVRARVEQLTESNDRATRALVEIGAAVGAREGEPTLAAVQRVAECVRLGAAHAASCTTARLEDLDRLKKAEAERDAAVADNAALLMFVTPHASVACEAAPNQDCGDCTSCLARLHVAQPHPGAVLLERVKRLEAIIRHCQERRFLGDTEDEAQMLEQAGMDPDH
jgi:hypothetical protein